MRSTLLALLAILQLSAVCPATTPNTSRPPTKQPPEDMEAISDLNRRIWGWKRCIYRWEKEHGPVKDDKPPEVCGPEPKLPPANQ